MFQLVIRLDACPQDRYCGPVILPDMDRPWRRQRVPSPEARAARARRILASRK